MQRSLTRLSSPSRFLLPESGFSSKHFHTGVFLNRSVVRATIVAPRKHLGINGKGVVCSVVVPCCGNLRRYYNIRGEDNQRRMRWGERRRNDLHKKISNLKTEGNWEEIASLVETELKQKDDDDDIKDEDVAWLLLNENERNTTTSDTLALNGSIISLGKKGKWNELLRLIEKEKKQFSNVNWATAFVRLGRIIPDLDNIRRDPRFESFCNDYAALLEKKGMPWAGIREVVGVVHTIGKMRLINNTMDHHHHHPATKSILAFVSRPENAQYIVREGNEQDISNIAWSFATLGVSSPHLFAEIDARGDWLVEHGTPQAVANTAWAFATLGVTPSFHGLFAWIETRRAYWLVKNGTPQEVANTAWAFATLNVKAHRKFFSRIEKRAAWLVSNGNDQNIENIAWAMRKLDVECPNFFFELVKRREQRDGDDWWEPTLNNNNDNDNNNARIYSMKTKNYDAVALNKKIAILGREEKWKDILRLFQEKEKDDDRFDNVNWATAFSFLGRIKTLDRADHLFLSFVSEYASLLESRGLYWAGIRQVAHIVYTIGKMQQSPITGGDGPTVLSSATESILAFVSRKANARTIVREGNAQDVANIAWSFAKLKQRGGGVPSLSLSSPTEELFAEIEARANRLVTNGTPQTIANTAWAFAKLNIKNQSTDNKFFGAIENRAADWLVTNGKPQEIATIAWSFATLDEEFPTKLFAAIETRADWLVQNGTPQAIANTAWAFAKKRRRQGDEDAKKEQSTHYHKLLFAIEHRIDWLIANGTPQAVANIAGAFAKLGVPSPRVFAAIEKNAEWLVKNGTPQEIATLAWSFATMVYAPPDRIFAEIEKRAAFLVGNGRPQNVANTVWAATGSARFQYHSPTLMKETNSRGAWLANVGSTQHIARTAMAFANCGCDDATTFFAAVGSNNVISKLIGNGIPKEIINVCYAMVVLDLGTKHPDVFCRLWNAAIDAADTAMIPNEELLQMGRVLAFGTANGMKLPQPSAFLKEKIESAAAGVVVPNSFGSSDSTFRRDVATILGRLGLDCEVGVSVAGDVHNNNDRALFIDLACRSQMLAIECCGESSFLREVGTGKVTRRGNGATKAKRRFLQQTGWNVIDIDYRDYRMMVVDDDDAADETTKKTNLQRFELFLREKLRRQGGLQV